MTHYSHSDLDIARATGELDDLMTEINQQRGAQTMTCQFCGWPTEDNETEHADCWSSAFINGAFEPKPRPRVPHVTHDGKLIRHMV